MKKSIVMWTVLTVLSMFMLTGCTEPFLAGAGAGAAAYKELADNAQDDFIIAVSELNARTAEINAGVEGIDGTILIRPETIEAIKGLKGREKDPVTWIALASVLANAFAGGKVYGSRKVN